MVAVVDQFTKRIGSVNRHAWYVAGSAPTINTTTTWDKLTVIGAVTNTGESFYTWTEENLTRRHGIRFLRALRDEFGEDLVVFLDRAGYFFANDVREFVAGTSTLETVDDTAIDRVQGDEMELWYFPPKLPELNAVEGCWNQLQEWFTSRFVTDLTQLKRDLSTAVEEIVTPNIWNYLCNPSQSGK